MKYRICLLALSLLIFFFAHDADAAPWKRKTEPDLALAQSGRCEIPVCLRYDFGDHYFVYYASQRDTLIRDIPKGACRCNSFRDEVKNFNGSLLLSAEAKDGTILHNISVVRVWPQNHIRYRETLTSQERFEKSENQYEPLSGFAWKKDRFKEFDIFRSKKEYALGARRYVFVPKQAVFHFRGATQPIVFDTSLARKIDGEKFMKDGPTVAAQVSLTPTIQFFEIFTPRLVASEQWIRSMEKSAEVIDAHLFPK